MLTPNTLVEITGDGQSHPIGSGSAHWIQINASADNSGTARIGDSSVSETRGIPVTAGAGQMLPMAQPDPRQALSASLYDLAGIYYWVAVGDKVAICWA